MVIQTAYLLYGSYIVYHIYCILCGTSQCVFSVINPDAFDVRFHIAEFSFNVVLTIHVPVVKGTQA